MKADRGKWWGLLIAYCATLALGHVNEWIDKYNGLDKRVLNSISTQKWYPGFLKYKFPIYLTNII